MRLRRARWRNAALGLALSLAPAPAPVAAQGLLEFLFGPDPAPQQAAPRPRESAPGRRVKAQASGGPRSGAGFASDPGVGGFCVRTCDGYFFPLIKSMRATRQQSCELACPSASMDIYDGSSIETARNHKGQRYSALPRAFAYRGGASGDCVCNDPRSSQAYFERAGKDDPTLQNGDIFVDADGAFVYGGSKLVPLGEASFVSTNLRNRLRAMLRRSPAPTPTLTGTIAPAPSALEIPKEEQTGGPAAPQAAP